MMLLHTPVLSKYSVPSPVSPLVNSTQDFLEERYWSVREDVKVAKPAMMVEQLAEASKRSQKVCVLSPEEFWGSV